MSRLFEHIVVRSLSDWQGNFLTLPIPSGYDPLVVDYTHAGGDVDQIDFAGLDNNAAGGYIVKWNCVWSATNNQYPFGLTVNADQTATNYQKVGWKNTGTAIGSFAANDFLLHSQPNQNSPAQGIAHFHVYRASGLPSWTWSGSEETGGGPTYITHGGVVKHKSSHGNITSIHLRASTFARFVAGDRVQIYKSH